MAKYYMASITIIVQSYLIYVHEVTLAPESYC